MAGSARWSSAARFPNDYQLNEATLWSGGPIDWNNPKAKEVLPKVREAIFAGRYQEADKLCKQMQGPYNQSYQPMGDLRLTFRGDRGHAHRLSAQARSRPRGDHGDLPRRRRHFHPRGVQQPSGPGHRHPADLRSAGTHRFHCHRPTASSATSVHPEGEHPRPEREGSVSRRSELPQAKDPIRYDDREGMTFSARSGLAEGGAVSGDGKT